MAIEEKFGRLKQLMDTGKEKGYVLYDEVNELLTEDYSGGRELDDLLSDLDTAGVEILEEPKIEFDKKLEDGEEIADRAERSRPLIAHSLRSRPYFTRSGPVRDLFQD